MSDYQDVIRGSFRLKGESSLKPKDGKVKKKKKNKDKKDKKDKESIKEAAGGIAEEASGQRQELEVQRFSIAVEKTAAELAFEAAQAKRKVDWVNQQAKRSHKQKVDDFNNYLSQLSEHNDLPRIGGGG